MWQHFDYGWAIVAYEADLVTGEYTGRYGYCDNLWAPPYEIYPR
jgi:hypothetical protein